MGLYRDMNTADALVRSYVDGSVETVNLIDLINTLDGSLDCGDSAYWIDYVFIEKVRDCQMSTIVNSILDAGMTCPLNVIFDGNTFIMGNGHHRLIAALLCGIEDIPIYVTRHTDWGKSEIEDYDNMTDFEDQSCNDDLIDIYNDVATLVYGC